MKTGIAKWLHAIFKKESAEPKEGITRWLWAILISAILLFGLGMILAPISFLNLFPRWRSYLLMGTVFIMILFLSYFPIFIYMSFTWKVRERARIRTLEEIQRYEPKPDVIKSFEKNFDKAYEQTNYRIPLILVTISLVAGWVLFFSTRVQRF
jgi:hypothetical protein